MLWCMVGNMISSDQLEMNHFNCHPIYFGGTKESFSIQLSSFNDKTKTVEMGKKCGIWKVWGPFQKFKSGLDHHKTMRWQSWENLFLSRFKIYLHRIVILFVKVNILHWLCLFQNKSFRIFKTNTFGRTQKPAWEIMASWKLCLEAKLTVSETKKLIWCCGSFFHTFALLLGQIMLCWASADLNTRIMMQNGRYKTVQVILMNSHTRLNCPLFPHLTI